MKTDVLVFLFFTCLSFYHYWCILILWEKHRLIEKTEQTLSNVISVSVITIIFSIVCDFVENHALHLTKYHWCQCHQHSHWWLCANWTKFIKMSSMPLSSASSSILSLHSVSFSQIHSGEDVCHGGVNFEKLTSPWHFFLYFSY